MTQLIVALDCDAPKAGEIFCRLKRELGLTWFKIGIGTLLEHSGMILVENMMRDGVDLFIDAKLYDTRDTVERVARRAFDLGARFLTVHATPSMLEAAMRAKPPGDYHKVLAVGPLTDNETQWPEGFVPIMCDGLIRSADVGFVWKANAPDKILVCPGIRPSGWPTDNHINPATPAEAKAAGADFIVVGRPIYAAPDPVAAALAIMDEIAYRSQREDRYAGPIVL